MHNNCVQILQRIRSFFQMKDILNYIYTCVCVRERDIQLCDIKLDYHGF